MDLPELAADIQKHGSRARLLADADEIVQTVAPEMRRGDVVAILSNGGFGGIYEKLPAQLRALAGESEQHQVSERGRKAMKLPVATRGTARPNAPLRLAALEHRCRRRRHPTPSLTTPFLLPSRSSIWSKCRSYFRKEPAQRELQLPVWNALYQVRDFAKYVNWVRAKDRAGRALAVRALNPSRWQIIGAEGGAVVEYQIFVDSPGPFGAQFNSHHAFFNLAQVLMYPVEARSGPMLVRFNQVPEGWHIATPLTSVPEDKATEARFGADNYDRLVDSPVEIGDFKESDFDEGGGHYRVIVDAEPADYDMGKIDGMLHKIVAAATSWMDDRPFDNYMFLYHFPRGPAGGGMEHSYSTAIAVHADVPLQAPEVLESVTAHEFFHLWNVKRIRPRTLEPVDYTRENYTRALWFSEGCTSTAADIIELRAGLLDERHFERLLASESPNSSAVPRT